jgi:hypothetical protein
MSLPLAESIAPRAAASSMPIVTCGERTGIHQHAIRSNP